MRLAAFLVALASLPGAVRADPPIVVPSADSPESYAQVRDSVSRRPLDEHRIRCMWRGPVVDEHKTMLVVWFTPKTDAMRSPELSDVVRQLEQALEHEPRIDVLVVNVWIPMLGGLAVRGGGLVMRRERSPRSPSRWPNIDPKAGAESKQLFDAVLRTFGGIKLN